MKEIESIASMIVKVFSLTYVYIIGVVLFAMIVGHLPWSVDKYGHIKNLQELLDGKFTIPSTLSKGRLPYIHVACGMSACNGCGFAHMLTCILTEARDLLRKMIEPNSQKRATLHEVKNHPWVSIGYSAPPPCYLEVCVLSENICVEEWKLIHVI